MAGQAPEIEDALTIPIPQVDGLRTDGARRVTGPGMLWSRPCAVLDVDVSGFDRARIIDLWQAQARRVLGALGWNDQQITSRQYAQGVTLAMPGPVDQLYTAVFAAETAWYFCASALLGLPADSFETMIDDLKSVAAREANPRLAALWQQGSIRDLDILHDEDAVTIGHGVTSQTWPIDDAPDITEVDWVNLANIPVILITGTNGKTTTTRLCSSIAKAAGKVSGLTSTEFVRVGDDILERGDFSGPGGARMLLRDKRLEVAVLEVARGGILRRGLPLKQASVAVVTNVAADHLGQYGVNTVADLAVAKFAVHRALKTGGVLVLNADDDYVVAEAMRTKTPVWWFALNQGAARIMHAKENKQPCAWLEGSTLMFSDVGQISEIIDVSDIPIAMDGAARYNVANALAALCASLAIGIEIPAIRAGLANFKNNPTDNPGRCNEFAINGARVFVDFAHNPHSIAAVIEAMAGIPAKRRFVMLSHAGDRSDQDIRDATTAALVLKPDYVMAAELPEYLRGREIGEVTALIRQSCRQAGLREDQLLSAPSPYEGAQIVLAKVAQGDLALLLVLSERDRIFEMLGA